MDKKNNRTKLLIKDTFWFTVGNIGSKLITLLLLPLYTSLLTTAEYGQIDLITTTVNLLIPVLTISIQDGILRFCLEKNEDKNSVFSLSVVIILNSMLLIGCATPLVNTLIPSIKGLTIYYCLIFMSSSFLQTLSVFLKTINKNRLFALQSIIYSFLVSGLSVVFLVGFNFGIKGYLASIIIANISTALIVFLVGKLYKYVSFKKLNKRITVKVIGYCAPLIVASIAWWAMESIDKYMLLYMIGEEANGLYGAASKLPLVISVATSVFMSAWVISAIKNVDDENNSSYTFKLYDLLICWGGILVSIMIFLSKTLGKFLLSGDFFNAWHMIPSLCVSAYFSALSAFFGTQFTAMKKSHLHLITNLAVMFINVALNYLFIKLLGINGAAIATMLSFMFVLLLRQIITSRLMKVRFLTPKSIAVFCILSIAALLNAFENESMWMISLASIYIIIALNLRTIVSSTKILIRFLRRNKI